ncbi:MAG: AmmeMemoRadiSam system protein B [Sandaracinaceae bacterium]|nr:AmmeMemoRadiSam system protein B [Sandaracinaceae bacterium]
MERRAFLAGSWYPGDERGCREAIAEHAQGTEPEAGEWWGLIGPHAGWAYSGGAAAHAYRWLASARDPELAVVFGSHRGPLGPNTIFCAGAWQTPLGALATDMELAITIRDTLDLDEEPVAPLRPDNAVELHLPFVRAFFPRARLIMIGVAASEVALAIGRRVGELVRGRDTVYVGSTDLTHYGPNYGFAPAGRGARAVQWTRDNDQGFLQAVLRNDARGALAHASEHQSACCPGAVAATIEAVRADRGTPRPKLIDHYLSYDVRPDDSFVGYAGLVL